MRIIHVSLDTLGKLFTEFDKTRLSIYEISYQSYEVAFIGVHLVLIYGDDIILIREYNDCGSARLPSTILGVPEYMRNTEITKHEVDFEDVVEWNLASAVCDLRDDFNGYYASLKYGHVSLADVLRDIYGIQINKSMFYATVGKANPCDREAKIYCCIRVDKINTSKIANSQLVYVPYTTLKKYSDNRHDGFYEKVYRDDMHRQYPIYSDQDEIGRAHV